MLLASNSGLWAALAPVADAWAMSFSSVHYLLFLPLAVGAYFVLPQKARRPWLLLASYYFYFFTAPRHLVVLLVGTVFTWGCGRGIAAAKTPRGRRGGMLAAVGGLVLGLAFFKYNGFFATFLSPLFAQLGVNYNGAFFSTAAALGISFYTFTAIGYLIDLARGDVPAEKNLLDVALFLGFFPTVRMGPIARAGTLLPQLKQTDRRFDPQGAAEGLRRMAVGFFKKLAVADTIALLPNAVYGDLGSYQGLSLTLAAVAYALQLYFDFSGYSDIAVGSARLLGIKLPENFANPYFATNFSTFWSRWHISLSGWLQDYVFTPLVWSRWTEKLPWLGRRVQKPPVLSAIAVTFILSGVWHGDTLCYLVWGGLMALYRIGEELAHRWLGKPKKNAGPWVRAGKTVLVLVLWVESLVFFRVGAQPGGQLTDALAALGRQFLPASLGRVGADITGAVAAGFFDNTLLVALFILFSLFCLALALAGDWVENFRLKNGHVSEGLGRLGRGPRYALYTLLVLCCFAAFIAQGGGGFLYGGY